MAVDVDAHIRQRAFGALSRFRFMFSGLVAVALSMTKIHQVRLQLPINREYDVSRLDIAVNDTSVMDLMKNFYLFQSAKRLSRRYTHLQELFPTHIPH
jgi:hypothetical protein